MKIFYTITLTMLLINTGYSQISISIMNKLEIEVLETVKEWNRSFAKNDPETYFTFIHNDLSLFVPSSPYRIEGKIDDREEFEWSLKDGRTKVSLFQEMQPKVKILSPTSALVTYHTRGVYGYKEREQMVYLKETNILVKENNDWKIVHIHVSK